MTQHIGALVKESEVLIYPRDYIAPELPGARIGRTNMPGSGAHSESLARRQAGPGGGNLAGLPLCRLPLLPSEHLDCQSVDHHHSSMHHDHNPTSRCVVSAAAATHFIPCCDRLLPAVPCSVSRASSPASMGVCCPCRMSTLRSGQLWPSQLSRR